MVKSRDIEDVLILSGDHVYKMNYLQLVASHRMSKASLAVSAIRVRKEQAAGTLSMIEINQGEERYPCLSSPTWLQWYLSWHIIIVQASSNSAILLPFSSTTFFICTGSLNDW